MEILNELMLAAQSLAESEQFKSLFSSDNPWGLLLIAGIAGYFLLKMVLNAVKAVIIVGVLVFAVSQFFPELNLLPMINEYLENLRQNGINTPEVL